MSFAYGIWSNIHRFKGISFNPGTISIKKDEEGWKMNELQWIDLVETQVEQGKLSREKMNLVINDLKSTETHHHVNFVTPVPKFLSCLKTLESIFDQEIST